MTGLSRFNFLTLFKPLPPTLSEFAHSDSLIIADRILVDHIISSFARGFEDWAMTGLEAGWTKRLVPVPFIDAKCDHSERYRITLKRARISGRFATPVCVIVTYRAKRWRKG
jgi:hypothetical protein